VYRVRAPQSLAYCVIDCISFFPPLFVVFSVLRFTASDF